jgi:hypothetical protein
MTALRDYLSDPFLGRLYRTVRDAGPLRSISVDLTHRCNLRCEGCYFFSEGMDVRSSPPEEAFDAFVERERARGTNFVTVVGGEPALELRRLEKIHDRFWMNVATNGLVPIPREGFERMPIGISVWGDRETDRRLRGGGTVDVFSRALRNYRDDPRAFWYYTVGAGHAHEVEAVVGRCIDNGNYVLFNFYGDVGGFGGDLDHRRGFDRVRREIDRMIELYPDRILMTSYLSRVVATGTLYAESWGHSVCTSISADHEANRERIRNGKPYNPHFRAYNADLQTTRRCCTGVSRDCSSCFDVWEHFSWIMLNLKPHLGSAREFTAWLSTMFLFYLINRIIDFEANVALLPEIHQRLGTRSEAGPAPSVLGLDPLGVRESTRRASRGPASSRRASPQDRRGECRG